MTFKLAIVLVIAVVGQGLALPRTEIESSKNERFAEVAISSHARGTDLSAFAGLQNCMINVLRIFQYYREKIPLRLVAFVERFLLIRTATACFFRKDVSDVYDCGKKAFDAYEFIITSIAEEIEDMDFQYGPVFKTLPNCLNEIVEPPILPASAE